jgi:hypothetical protein
MKSWKNQLRADLVRSGEQAVRGDMNTGGGLATGGEDRRQVIRAWLREELAKRQKKRAAVYEFTLPRRTYFAAAAALMATIAGIVIALLHR